MLRFVVEKHEYNFNSGRERRDMFTIDFDVPDLETMLTGGGQREMGFESWRLLGVEVLTPQGYRMKPRTLEEAESRVRSDVEVSGGRKPPA